MNHTTLASLGTALRGAVRCIMVGRLTVLVMLLALCGACSRETTPTSESLGSTSEAVINPKTAPIDPLTASIPVNVDQQFTSDLSNPVWSVSDATLASVTATGLVTGLQPGSVTVFVTDGKTAAKATLTITTFTLRAIAIDPTTQTIGVGVPKSVKVGKVTKPPFSFVATGTFQDGKTSKKYPLRAATTTWASSDVAIATISSSGEPEGVAPGVVQITATDVLTGLQGTAKLTVTGAAITAVDVTPPKASLPVGVVEQLTATGTYAATKSVTGPAKAKLAAADVVWSVDDPTIVSVDDTGLVQALAVGSTHVVATDIATGISGYSVVTVNSAILSSIEVTEPAKSEAFAMGVALPLTATGIFSNKTKIKLAPDTTTWTSSDDTLATVSATGEATCVSTAAGTMTITATDTASGVSGSLTLTIHAATLKSLEVSDPGYIQPKTTAKNPPPVTTVDLPIGTTQPFVLTAIYSDGQKVVQTSQAAWKSSNTKLVTVSNTVGSVGDVTGVKAGTVHVSADLGGKEATLDVVVRSATITSIAVTPASSTLPNGETKQLTATATYNDHTVADVTDMVTWTSSSEAVHVSNAGASSGLATAMALGTASITASDPASTTVGTALITVTPAVLQSLAITPPVAQAALGGDQQFHATGVFSDATTKDMTAEVLWTSSAPKVASISNAKKSNGLALALALGTTTIGAFDGTSGVAAPDATLTVRAVTLTGLTISPPSSSIAAGLDQTFKVTGTYSDGSTKDLTTEVTWSVTSGSATISNAPEASGVATGEMVGTNTIQALEPSSGLTATAVLNVTPAVLSSIAVTGALSSIAAGTTDAFTATGTFSDGTTKDLTATVTWSASNGDAAVSNVPGTSGVATGTVVGTTTITATDVATGITGSAPLTVTPAALVSIAVTPGSTSTTAGLVREFTATGTYTDGSTQPLTAVVTWASSPAGLFAISNAAANPGLATALAPGLATISATDPTTQIVGTTTATVTPAILQSVTVTPANPSAAVGATQQFFAIGTYSDGSTASVSSTVTWAAAPASVATASTTGLVTGQGVGTATVSATDPATGIVGTAALTITPAVPLSIPATSIGTGSIHACALLSTGGVACWGDNAYGQLGNGATANSSTPVAVSFIANATSIAVGQAFACALLGTGAVECWGMGMNGALGNGGTANALVPTPVTGITNAVAITAGVRHACALLSTGTLECWGDDTSGELGNGLSGTQETTPVVVTGITSPTSIAAGSDVTCAILPGGTLECWGDNQYGQLGDGTTTNARTPVAVSSIANVTAVATGGDNTCAVAAGGAVYCWGLGDAGALGDGTLTNSSVPVPVSGLSGASAVSVGINNAGAILASGGTVEFWGDDSWGETGPSGNYTCPAYSYTYPCDITPMAVPGVSGATGLSVNAFFSCALLTGGEVECWGDNADGQLGDGNTTFSAAPVQVVITQ